MESNLTKNVKPKSDGGIILICILQNPKTKIYEYKSIIFNSERHEKVNLITSTNSYVEKTESFLIGESELLIFSRPNTNDLYQLKKFSLN